MLFITTTFLVKSTTIEISNLDDGQYVAPLKGGEASIKSYSQTQIPSVLEPISSFNIPGKEEGVRIASLCTSASTNLIQSRAYAMAGLANKNVPTDRTANPPAWYIVPMSTPSWQLQDGVQTAFHSWLGSTFVTNPATTVEYGHRLVVHAAGLYPISKYWCRISTTSTNYPGAYFPIATNISTGAEIAFNANFIGIKFGTNGTLDSSINLTTGVWTQGGDDTIYSNGELPSTVQYDWWYRFGATVVINITQPSGFDSLKSEFSMTNQSLTAELVVPSQDNQVLDRKTIVAAQSELQIWNENEQNVRLKISGGQTLLHYQIMSTNDIVQPLPWPFLHGGALYNPEQSWLEPNNPDQKGFFRLLAVP